MISVSGCCRVGESTDLDVVVVSQLTVSSSTVVRVSIGKLKGSSVSIRSMPPMISVSGCCRVGKATD
jgi:hypothetical protein